MKLLIQSCVLILVSLSLAFSQAIVTPIFIHKDGEASATGYSGSDKDIMVDGGTDPIVGWITFQTAGVDLSAIKEASLTLYVKSLDAPGTLEVYGLGKAITNPENTVLLTDISYGNEPAAKVPLVTANIETVLKIDILSLLTSGTFYGIALASQDGLIATFDAKEGHLDPVILLTHAGGSSSWRDSTGQVRTDVNVGIGKDPKTALDVSGTVTATAFAGNGSALTNLPVNIPDGSITNEKLAADAVDQHKIADDAIRSEHVFLNSLTSQDLAANSVGKSELDDDAVDYNALCVNSVGVKHIRDNCITSPMIDDGGIELRDLATKPVSAFIYRRGAKRLTTTGNFVCTLSVTVPSRGYITVNVSAFFQGDISNSPVGDEGVAAWARISEGDLVINDADMNELNFHPDATITGAFHIPLSLLKQYTVTSAGTYTYYVLGKKIDREQTNVNIKNINMSAIFIPY